jgi:hypothetical protein
MQFSLFNYEDYSSMKMKAVGCYKMSATTYQNPCFKIITNMYYLIRVKIPAFRMHHVRNFAKMHLQ